MSERPTMKTWDLPDITTEDLKAGESRNALNKPRKWHYEPPEPEPEEEKPEPLTAQQLEEIREAAREEGFKAGFEQGHQEGLEKGHEEGVEQGREKGFHAGFEQGLADGKAQMSEAEQALIEVMNGLAAPTQQLTETLRKELLELVFTLTRTACLNEPLHNENIVNKAFQQALEVLPVTDQRVIIHLNPDDIEVIQASLGEEELKEKGWLLSKDELLERGGCRVTTESSSVDYSLASRVDLIFEKLQGG
ncbi:MAG: Flagellar assembly protein [Idiomarina sp. T82-3]|uniref:flagellar assembly protein FliH n=1 Tax=Idiomarina TaxID=135575 RepID=UPI000792BE15|nr:flagellar assembly protein FliH [Idiomarina sp. T82-3]KXS34129.1 MAG: Flagellar assembly protein [Idiomarina sp. T82-3]